VIGEAASVPATDCTYNPWMSDMPCVCTSASASSCYKTFYRTEGAPPANGGATCSYLSYSAQCGM
jgi:hypothetical protein